MKNVGGLFLAIVGLLAIASIAFIAGENVGQGVLAYYVDI